MAGTSNKASRLKHTLNATTIDRSPITFSSTEPIFHTVEGVKPIAEGSAYLPISKENVRYLTFLLIEYQRGKLKRKGRIWKKTRLFDVRDETRKEKWKQKDCSWMGLQ
uniref:Uncharacterized protein n=1 Tax=Beta vulgaris TaxID=161934 RepID=E2DMZ7_BETVU|nr:hypothetical protein [Beta vulgaris]